MQQGCHGQVGLWQQRLAILSALVGVCGDNAHTYCAVLWLAGAACINVPSSPQAWVKKGQAQWTQWGPVSEERVAVTTMLYILRMNCV